MTQAIPPAAKVRLAVKRWARTPMTSEPNGARPVSIMVQMAIKRPRNSSGTRFCTVVFVAAICEVAANPTTNNTAQEIQKICDCENAINPIAQITDIAAIHFANPL